MGEVYSPEMFLASADLRPVQSKCSRAARAADENGEEADEGVYDRESHFRLLRSDNICRHMHLRADSNSPEPFEGDSNLNIDTDTARQPRCTQGLSSDASMTASMTSQQNHYIAKRRAA